jgi:hypothetical protein
MIGSEFRITGDEAKWWLELAKKEINPRGLDNWPSRAKIPEIPDRSLPLLR